VNAADYSGKSAMDKASAKNAGAAGYINAGGTLLSKVLIYGANNLRVTLLIKMNQELM